MNLGTRGGKARTPGPSETPEFCAAWEAKRAAGETDGMTGSREHYARTFAWGQAEARERCAVYLDALRLWRTAIDIRAGMHEAPPKDKP